MVKQCDYESYSSAYSAVLRADIDILQFLGEFFPLVISNKQLYVG